MLDCDSSKYEVPIQKDQIGKFDLKQTRLSSRLRGFIEKEERAKYRHKDSPPNNCQERKYPLGTQDPIQTRRHNVSWY